MRLFLPVALITLFNCSILSGQQLDSTFHSAVPVRASLITHMVKQPDDKVLLGGQLAFHGNIPVNNLIRITVDGALDSTFSLSYSPDYYVHDFELMDNGDIAVLIRRFQGYKDLVFSESKILVLTEDGTLTGESNTIPNANTIAVQHDGKILVCGENLLVRYNGDLSEDSAFNAAVTFDNLVSDVKVNNDKIFTAGMFHLVNGRVKHSIVKLNLDGSIDDSFDTGSGTTDYIGALTIAPDGKILTGDAYINEFDGLTRRGMVRLNTDGSVDGTFGILFQNGIGEPVITTEGIYACSYMAINGVHGLNLFRLTNDGSWDNTFEPVLFKGFDHTSLNYIAVGDQLVASGQPVSGNRFGISKYDNTGSLIPAFAPKISRLGTIQFGDQRDGKIIVGGDFVKIDSVNTFGVAQLNFDGSVDESFSAKNDQGAVVQMELLEDETTLVSTGSKFYKVNNSGDLVTDFNWAPSGFLYQVVKFKVLANDKILAADPNTLVLLNSNGSVDESFYVGHTSNSSVYGFDVQGDSVIYGFNAYDEDLGEVVTHINRYTIEGKIDTTFHVGEGPQKMQPSEWTYVTMVKVLDNGEVLIGGGFTQFDGLPVQHGLVKLSRDGKIDVDFNTNQLAATGPMGFFDPVVEQIGSKVYIRSDYSIYVINLDGTVDSFQIPLTVDGISDIIAVENNEPDHAGGRRKSGQDHIIALGSFQNANIKARMSVVKIAVTSEIREETVTGITETGQEPLALEIYPQPTSGILNIRFETHSTGFHAAVYDLSGRKYMEQSFNTTAGSDVPSMDVSQIPAGFYTFKVVSKSGRTGYSKFVRLP